MVAYAEMIRNQHKTLNPSGKMGESILQGDSISNRKFIRRVRNLNGSLTVSGKKAEDEISIDNSIKEIKSERARRKDNDELNPYSDGINNLNFLKGMIR